MPTPYSSAISQTDRTLEDKFLMLAPEAALSLAEKRTVFENILMKDRQNDEFRTVWSLHNIANRTSPKMASLNAVLLLSAKAGEELGYHGCLYKLTNVCTGECYIGQTKRPFHVRIKDHIELATKHNPAEKFHPLYAAINRQGLETFAVQVVHVVWKDTGRELPEGEDLAQEQLNDAEKEFIARENSHWTKGLGYNRTAGGAGTTDIDEVSRIVRDLRMAVNKYGAFALLRQVYVLTMADSGLSRAEISRRAGYASSHAVSRIIDANSTEKRGGSVRAALPYLTEVLNSQMGIANKNSTTLESLLSAWSKQVLNTSAIFEKLSKERPARGMKPSLVTKIEEELASPVKALNAQVPVEILFVKREPTSCVKKPKSLER